MGASSSDCSLRARRFTGPTYGVVVWLAFELGIGPVLGVQHRQGGRIGGLMLVLDHALYGIVVAGGSHPTLRLSAPAQIFPKPHLLGWAPGSSWWWSTASG